MTVDKRVAGEGTKETWYEISYSNKIEERSVISHTAHFITFFSPFWNEPQRRKLTRDWHRSRPEAVAEIRRRLVDYVRRAEESLAEARQDLREFEEKEGESL